MKVIFGLGNPGQQYKKNRHNIGYIVADELAGIGGGVNFKRSFRLSAMVAGLTIAGCKIWLVKPRTFMNNSGQCVKKFLANYKISVDDVLVIYDDVDLRLGEIRFREKGSCGGHKGMESIASTLKREDISRLRVGIDRPTDGELSDYVLSDFPAPQAAALKSSIKRAIAACVDWISRGPDFVMKAYNRRSSTQ